MKSENKTKGEQVARQIFEILAYIPILGFGYWILNLTIKLF